MLLCLALALVFSLPLVGQTVSGNLQGTVSDSSGAALPGVTVTIRNMETGFERVVVTNEKGFYSAPFLPIGKYRVRAELAGLNSVEQTNVDVALNFTRIADFTLTMSGVAETITVTAETPRINKVNAEINQSLTAEEVIDRPMAATIGVSAFLELATTFAGYNENPTSGQNNPTASSGSSIIFGAGTRGATFQINGVNNDDSSENQNRQGVPLSTIKEFQILSSTYSAEFGRGQGAVVLVQTKSGTNEFAGDVYGFYNDNKWNAKPWPFQNSPRAERTREQYGLTFGGPVMLDRVHFFGSIESTEQSGEQNILRDIITDELLALPRLTRGNDTPENRAFIEDIIRRFPTTTPNRTDLGPRRWGTLQTIAYPDDDESIRFDADLVANHHGWLRYQHSMQKRETADVIIGEQALQDHDQQNFGLTLTSIWTPNLVGEFRYGLGIRDTNVNIAAGNDTPIVRFQTVVGTGIPNGSIIGNAGNFPIQRYQKDNQFVYNINWMPLENHQLKVGADIRRQQLDDLADNFSRGYWQIAATCGGQTYPTPYHALFDGCVARFDKGYGNFFLENRIDEDNLYVEDAWQALDNLTLNLGVRLERVSVPEETENRIDYMYGDSDYVDPRVSFAYTLGDLPGMKWLTGGANRSVIRGGFGVYHGRVFQSVFSQGGANVRFNPPNAAYLNFLNSTNIADPSNGFTFEPGKPATARVSLTSIESDLKMPETEQWNLTFEREMPWESSLRLTYESKQGANLLRYWYDNLPLSPLNGPITVANHPFNGALAGKVIDKVNPDPCAGTGLPGVPTNAQCPVPVPLGDNEISRRVPRTNERRPNPLYTTNLMVSDEGESDYTAWTVQWVKRFSDNLHFQASYTYSEYLDNTSEATFVGAGDTNGLGPNSKYSWGYSRFDTPHQFKFYGTYNLPFFKDRKDFLGFLLGGWTVSPVIKKTTGTPFTVFGGGLDIDWDGYSEGRPVLLDPSIEGRTIDDPDTAQQRLPRSAFRGIQEGDTVDMLTKRNAFRSDGLETIDLGIYKTFPLVYGMDLTVRIETFNLLDEIMYGIPNTAWTATSTTFGSITGTSNIYAPRTTQVGFRLTY